MRKSAHLHGTYRVTELKSSTLYTCTHICNYGKEKVRVWTQSIRGLETEGKCHTYANYVSNQTVSNSEGTDILLEKSVMSRFPIKFFGLKSFGLGHIEDSVILVISSWRPWSWCKSRTLLRIWIQWRRLHIILYLWGLLNTLWLSQI